MTKLWVAGLVAAAFTPLHANGERDYMCTAALA
jgi:hypothetical protein